MRHRSAALTDPNTLAPAGDDPHVIQVVIETPKGSRNKYAFNAVSRIFSLKKVLPAGMAFRYDFGFVPSIAGAGVGDISGIGVATLERNGQVSVVRNQERT
jgi:hypothetical protein